MATETEPERQPGNTCTQRYPTRSSSFCASTPGAARWRPRTTIRDNVVVVMLHQTLTKGERVLVTKGRAEKVLALRREYQEAMREETSARVGELTGRKVVAMMSANHSDPDLAAEIYVLDAAPNYGATGLAAGAQGPIDGDYPRDTS